MALLRTAQATAPTEKYGEENALKLQITNTSQISAKGGSVSGRQNSKLKTKMRAFQQQNNLRLFRNQRTFAK